MRDKQTLIGMNKIATLLQHLYIAEGNTITVENAIGVKLEISMDEHCRFVCKNLNHPTVPPMVGYDFPISSQLAAIEQLEEQPAMEFPKRFKSRWEEIETITRSNMALNEL